jgi:flagellar motor switch protein FliG
VILSLDEGLAEEVMRNLDEADLVRLAKAVDELDRVPQTALQPALEEFERRLQEPVIAGRGNLYIRRLAANAIGKDRAQQLLNSAPDDTGPLSVIRSARASTLAELLEQEHPQIAAVIISQLPPVQAARVLRAMREDRQADVVARVAKIEEIPAESLQVASESVLKALTASGGTADNAERRDFDGVSYAASLLNELPSDDTERLLERLEDDESGVAPRIREAMFTFEDLTRLDKRSLQILMREIAADQLILALRTASESMRELFFSAMSRRAAAMMQEDLELMPPRRLSEVDAAQREIIETAMRLAADRQIFLPRASAEELV